MMLRNSEYWDKKILKYRSAEIIKFERSELIEMYEVFQVLYEFASVFFTQHHSVITFCTKKDQELILSSIDRSHYIASMQKHWRIHLQRFCQN